MLIKLRFIQTQSDDCLYLYCSAGEIVLIVLVYVNDMAIASRNGCKIISFKKDLSSHFDIMDLGEICYILELQISHNWEKYIIRLNQSAYIDSVLEH